MRVFVVVHVIVHVVVHVLIVSELVLVVELMVLFVGIVGMSSGTCRGKFATVDSICLAKENEK